MSTYQELLAQKKALEVQLEDVRQHEVAAAVAKIRQLMDQYGLEPADLGRRRVGPRNPKARAAPMYQDPKTGKTWTGRGRAPAWIGKNRERFRIA